MVGNETTNTKGSSMICTLASHVLVMTESVVQSDLQSELNFHHEVPGTQTQLDVCTRLGRTHAASCVVEQLHRQSGLIFFTLSNRSQPGGLWSWQAFPGFAARFVAALFLSPQASFCCARVRIVFRFPCRSCLSGRVPEFLR